MVCHMVSTDILISFERACISEGTMPNIDKAVIVNDENCSVHRNYARPSHCMGQHTALCVQIL